MRISDWSSDVCSSDLPFNLSVNEETGLLVDGANTPPMLMMGHDHPYVGSRIEALGYRGAKDLLAYLLDLEKAPSEGLKRVISKQPKNLRIRQIGREWCREGVGQNV